MKRATILLALIIVCASHFSTDAAEPRAPANQQSEQDPKVELQFLYRCENRETPAEHLAGEWVYVATRLSGVQSYGEGKIDVRSSVDLVDSTGETIVTGKRGRLSLQMTFGGGEINYVNTLQVPASVVGNCTLRVTVDDQVSGRRARAELPLKVLDPGTLGIKDLHVDLDSESRWIEVIPEGRDAVVKFKVNGSAIKGGHRDLEVNASFTDERGNLLISKVIPLGSPPESIYGDSREPEVDITFNANRAGRFLLHLTVKDHIGGKEAKRVVPINVAGLQRSAAEVTAGKDHSLKR